MTPRSQTRTRIPYRLPALACAFLLAVSIARLPSGAADELERVFRDPPRSTMPWVYWYWISDNISKEGITRDLEAMRRVGIGEALIGNIYLDAVEIGDVKVLSEQWWALVEHAIREGDRLGVDIGMFNCPGWSQSGGPWIRPEQSMRHVTTSEVRLRGPARFEGALPTPAGSIRDLVTLAFPAPPDDSGTLHAIRPSIAASPALPEVARLVDGDTATPCSFPEGATRPDATVTLDIETPAPFTARSILLTPGDKPFAARCELFAQTADGAFHTLRAFAFDRSNFKVNVGFLPRGPVSISFPAATSRKFRLVLSQIRGKGGLAEIDLQTCARVEQHVEKQLGKMHPTPLPAWDTYVWPPAPEPDATAHAIPRDQVRDLTPRVGQDGVLRWDVPQGEWILLRAGIAPTGTTNAPASPEGRGLEVDKMNRDAARAHFDAFIGKLLARIPPDARRAFRHVVADSYEMGSQNWTDDLAPTFRARYGYDPIPWLPTLTGRIVGDADRSDRFLWDLRRLVADRIATEYVGGLRERCAQHGLQLWLENYGHWGFPAEFLQYGGQADHVSGEFWATGDLGSIELRAASSAAHTYRKRVVSAEAFTSVLGFESTPWSLKRRGDWALTEGINHWVLHVYIHQPRDDRRPGVNAWFSTEFNRHNTWFEQMRAWIDSYRRVQALLQQGLHVADVAYFIGEDTPKMTGPKLPELPPGTDYDHINAEVLLRHAAACPGGFRLPDGMSYRLLVLPPGETMRPEILRKIRDLVAGGATVLGAPPSRSPSMQDHPSADGSVRALASELWANCDGRTATHARFGKGHVLRGIDLAAALEILGIRPDVAGVNPAELLWTHRATADADIYFVTNQTERTLVVTPEFRVRGRLPELWDHASAEISQPATYESTRTGTRLPLRLDPRGSIVVLFRKPASQGSPSVTRVTRDGELILSTAPLERGAGPKPGGADSPGSFTMAGWARPSTQIALPQESDSGVHLAHARNDAVPPAHGGNLHLPGLHAGAGIAIGTNGIAVYEHSSDYLAPILVHPSTVADWIHVAVVYERGRPTLYLDGRRARSGLQSRYTTHSSLAIAGGAPRAKFQGDLAEFQHFDRPLTPAEIVALAAAPPPASGDLPLPELALSRDAEGGLRALASSNGSYRISFSDGASRDLPISDLPDPIPVDGPWEVRFPQGSDAPAVTVFDRLISLDEHPDPAIRHFSGTTIYTRTLDLPATLSGTGSRALLDLGRVESIAEVALNGKPLATLWKPPYRVDLTGIARPGPNTLEIRVTGTWRNRLLGAARHPDGFPDRDGKTKRPPSFRPHTSVKLKFPREERPAPSGLIGPVRLLSPREIDLR